MPQSFICPLAIICINSMPLNKMRAQRNVLNPNIDRVRRLIARWSCSTMLLRYLTWRILMGVSRPAFTACKPARSAPLLSMVTVSGAPF